MPDLVHADNWDTYTDAHLEAMRRFDERRDGANANQLKMLSDCIDANEFCMGSGWLDVHEFLDYLCEHPSMVCPGDRGSGLGEALAQAAASGMLFGGKDGSGATNPRGGGFLSGVDAERAVLDAAAYADTNRLWVNNQATVPVLNGPVGVIGRSGETTSWLTVTRTNSGSVHGWPSLP